MSAREDEKRLPTAAIASLVYGDGAVALDDPAEQFHEASKLYPSFVRRQTRGHVLEATPTLQAATLRAAKRYPRAPLVALPPPELPSAPFAAVVDARASARDFGDTTLSLATLAALLHAAYGTTRELEHAPAAGRVLRTVPSGGALFPLEIYVVPWRVDAVEVALYHFDPLRRVLERLGDVTEAAVAEAMVYTEPACRCAALFFLGAMLWRTRFKYGVRGYRFALLEAGHVAQNLQLAATASGLGSVPLGGFFDARVDELLGLDGVDEVSLYSVAVGEAGG